jgi:FKBP-type peptidyl-prolyl cis-trans isomerase SlyD
MASSVAGPRIGPKIEPNARVVLDYTLRDERGELLDSSTSDGGEPMVFVHGYGMIVPGLERSLAGLSVGDRKELVVTPEEGYGERDEELVIEVDRSEMPRPDAVTIGDELVAEAPDGDEAVMRVVEVGPNSVVLDGNHPLAGETLRYSVVVREVRAATEDEIESAAAAFEEAQSETPNETQNETPDLVQLRRPKR